MRIKNDLTPYFEDREYPIQRYTGMSSMTNRRRSQSIYMIAALLIIAITGIAFWCLSRSNITVQLLPSDQWHVGRAMWRGTTIDGTCYREDDYYLGPVKVRDPVIVQPIQKQPRRSR